MTSPDRESGQRDRLTLDSAVGIGLNQLGDLLGAPPLAWTIEQPSPGTAAEFHGRANASDITGVHAMLDRWADCFGLSERQDHGGMRENAGVVTSAAACLPVRLVVWGVINQAEFDDDPGRPGT